jgi:hypothetical protein
MYSVEQNYFHLATFDYPYKIRSAALQKKEGSTLTSKYTSKFQLSFIAKGANKSKSPQVLKVATILLHT